MGGCATAASVGQLGAALTLKPTRSPTAVKPGLSVGFISQIERGLNAPRRSRRSPPSPAWARATPAMTCARNRHRVQGAPLAATAPDPDARPPPAARASRWSVSWGASGALVARRQLRTIEFLAPPHPDAPFTLMGERRMRHREACAPLRAHLGVLPRQRSQRRHHPLAAGISLRVHPARGRGAVLHPGGRHHGRDREREHRSRGRLLHSLQVDAATFGLEPRHVAGRDPSRVHIGHFRRPQQAAADGRDRGPRLGRTMT